MKAQLQDVTTHAARALGLATTDTRLNYYINNGQEALFYKGLYKNVIAKYSVALSANTVVWPREVQTIEAASFNAQTGTIRNRWYQYHGDGFGLTDDISYFQLVDQGTTPIQTTFPSGSFKLRVYNTDAADDGAIARVWNGTTEESLVLNNATYAETTGTFTDITDFYKPATVDTVRLEAWTTGGVLQSVLATYAADETQPDYRVSKVPYGDGDTTTLTVLARKRFIPASAATDWLAVPNVAAVVDMAKAELLREQNQFELAEAMERKAIQRIDDQTRAYLGSAQATPKLIGAENYGGSINHIQ